MEPFEKDVVVTVWDEAGDERKEPGVIWGWKGGLQISGEDFTVQVDWASIAEALAHTAGRANDE